MSPGRHVQTTTRLLLTLVLWTSAVGLTWLHVTRGPAQQAVNVRWTDDTSALVRQALERTLRLRQGEEAEPGRWVYRLGDQSQNAIRRLVTHPAVADTGHIDRQTFRVEIDAPSMPAPLRQLLGMRLAPWVAGGLFLLGLLVGWPVRSAAKEIIAGLAVRPGIERAAALGALAWGFLLFHDNGHAVDENIHYDQILRFARGDWSLNPSLTMIPGFHALVAVAARATGGLSELSVRAVMLVLSAATVLTFDRLVQTLHGNGARGRTLQFTLLPLLFTQFFLVYTDVASLLFILLMMLAAVRGRATTAGVLGLASCLVRQNNVVWVAFAMVWMYVREDGRWRPSVVAVLRRYWSFIVVGVAFVAFVVANGGQAALGDDVGSHPLGAFYLTNLLFLLFLAGVTMLPLMAGSLSAIRSGARTPAPWLLAAVAGVACWFGFVVDHPHNLERADYFLPNALLQYLSSGALEKVLLSITVMASVVWLASIPLRRPWPLLFLFSVLFLLPEWLVTPRYYLIPLALFLAAREPAAPAAERVQTILWAVASAVLLVVMDRGLGWV